MSALVERLASTPLDRLVPQKHVAFVLGLTLDTFSRKRAALEARGFPQPLIGHSYDGLAIWAWRIAQMRPELRAVLETVAGAVVGGTVDWEAALAANAARIADAPLTHQAAE